MKIDVVSDFVCPWCFIGTRRLYQALGDRVDDVQVVHHPFLLDPRIPAGGIDLREHLGKRYGRPPQGMFDVVEGEAKKSGIPLDFAKVTRWSQTLPAHMLAAAVLEKSGGRAQHAFVEDVFRAYFLEGEDVGAPRVLTALGSRHGLADVDALVADDDLRRATLDEIRGAQAQGIGGVPFFVVDEKLAIEGAQPVEVFRAALAELGAR